MAQGSLDSKVLGQLLVMQSVVINLPNDNSIFSFVCKGLRDIPGVEDVVYVRPGTNRKRNLSSEINISVTLGDSYYGELSFSISDPGLFRLYEDYLKNFAFMLGVILEERKQRRLNEETQLQLEKRIQERTAELWLEKENLAEWQRRFNEMMANIKLLSVMLDADGNIIFCNNYFQDLTGYSADEILGKNWFAIFLPESILSNAKTTFQSIMCGATLANNLENEILTKQGEVRLILWNNTVLYDANRKRIGAANIGEDITQRKLDERLLKEKNEEIEAQNEEYLQLNEELLKAKEKAEESDRLKTAFLQNMSHEIRTPMNAIMGFSDLLILNSNDKAKLEKFLGIINQRCSDLLEIINDILDIAKIESGQVNINLEEFNLRDLFQELSVFFSEYQKRIKKEHLTFTVRAEEACYKQIITDKIKLKQIFINLINNAFKFTDSGKIEVGCTSTDNDNLLFYVADTGIGIPLEKQKLVFERFIQLKESSRMNLGGTGLGLSIVKGLLELLHGVITLTSEPGKGSTFTFKLPYGKVTSSHPQVSVTEDVSYKNLVNKTILIVEDDFFNMEYIKEILLDRGIHIMEAANGKEAIEIASSKPLDAVLMDIRLPDMNGYEVIKKITKYNPELIIIAQTAYASSDEKRKAKGAGCKDYISKPIKKDQLLSMLNSCFVK
jgi:PAS domain S-box-containing protein